MTLQKVLHFTGHSITRDLDKNLLDYNSLGYPFSVIPLSFICFREEKKKGKGPLRGEGISNKSFPPKKMAINTGNCLIY